MLWLDSRYFIFIFSYFPSEISIFQIAFISLSYSHSACFSMISSAHLFNLHFAFNGSIFLGAVFHSNLSRRLPLKYVFITCLILICACFSALTHAAHAILLLCIVFIVFGTVLGISLSAVTSNFGVVFKQQNFLLVQVRTGWFGINGKWEWELEEGHEEGPNVLTMHSMPSFSFSI